METIKDMNQTEYELTPQYDIRKSFYKKALIIIEEDRIHLQSYHTIVCTIKKDTNRPVVFGTYSQTTLRHIKEFLKQYGFQAESQRQILNDYGLKGNV